MGVMTDVTERKKVEEALAKIEIARKRKFTTGLKITCRLSPPFLTFRLKNSITEKDVKDSEVLEAFRESQDRVMSIALIHEELHEGGGDNTL